MFDKYFVSRGREYVPYEKTVNVHNAPTTDQARYLDELRAQAREDVLRGHLVEFDLGRVHVDLQRDHMTPDLILVLTFIDHPRGGPGSLRTARRKVAPEVIASREADGYLQLIRDLLSELFAELFVIRVLEKGMIT